MADPTVEIPTPVAPGNTDVHPGQSGTVIPPPPSGASDTAPNIPPPPQGASDTPPSTENVQPDSSMGLSPEQNMAVGAGKGLGETVTGIGTLLKEDSGCRRIPRSERGISCGEKPNR